MRAIIASIPLLLGLVACSGAQRTNTAPPPSMARDPRLRFNQLAMRLDLPLYWAGDQNNNGQPDPSEVRSLLFYNSNTEWTRDGQFTPAYQEALTQIRAQEALAAPSDPRLRLVHREFDFAAPTLVESNFRDLPPAHQAFARAMLVVADRIDTLYALQTGLPSVNEQVRALDPASRALFRRNWGPRCQGAQTESERQCSALPNAPRIPVGVYPASIQSDEQFCRTIERRPDASALMTPFTVVREQQGNLVAVPYTQVWTEPMRQVAVALRAAADVMTDPAETALVTYLRAAATSFETNEWGPADEAWSRMNARNSRWYVRAAPDETYWEPCSQKAGFHLTFARINRESLTWQERLTPLQGAMEQSIAGISQNTYTARNVSFHMPDFIDIVVNAGDDRDPFGATIGQSLPNWEQLPPKDVDAR